MKPPAIVPSPTLIPLASLPHRSLTIPSLPSPCHPPRKSGLAVPSSPRPCPPSESPSAPFPRSLHAPRPFLPSHTLSPSITAAFLIAFPFVFADQAINQNGPR